MTELIRKNDMPDIANLGAAGAEGSLNWVGMSGIHVPLMIASQENLVQVNATVQAYVSLDDEKAKGIHMSRLFLAVDKMSETPVQASVVKQLMLEFLGSHQGLSKQAFAEFKFDFMIRRKALKSDNSGWKSYPVTIRVENDGLTNQVEMMVEVPYSSTCPCSAALARQLIQNQFEKDFTGQSQVNADEVSQWLRSEKGIIATPHSQRSIAKVVVKLSESIQEFPLVELVNEIESVLKTPVQTAVKREDEQEFARLNGQNLMFCEDSARKVSRLLQSHDQYKDYWLRIDHYESLHAHDAVAVNSKGVAGGYSNNPTLF
jgi:GTP cyclohydrolase IB